LGVHQRGIRMIEEYKDETYRVIIELTPETIKLIREGTPIIHKSKYTPDIIVKVCKDD